MNKQKLKINKVIELLEEAKTEETYDFIFIGKEKVDGKAVSFYEMSASHFDFMLFIYRLMDNNQDLFSAVQIVSNFFRHYETRGKEGEAILVSAIKDMYKQEVEYE